MAWPNAVTAGQGALASDFNSVISALQLWGGNVSAGGYGVSDLSSVAARTGNASWQEFRLQAVAGSGLANDVLALQVNARSTAGGADAWSNVFSVAALTGVVSVTSPVTFNGALTLGAGLNLNGQTVSGASTFSGAVALNGGITLGAGGLNLNAQTIGGNGTFSGAITFSSPGNLTFGSNWTVWTPTITASGSMTISGASGNAVYFRIGKTLLISVTYSFNLGGTASNYIFFTLPFPYAGYTSIGFVSIANNGQTIGIGDTYGPNQVRLYVYNGANFVLGYCAFTITTFVQLP